MIFDTLLKQQHKVQAAKHLKERARQADYYLKYMVADRMVDRLFDLKEEHRQFPQVLDYGSGAGYFSKHLNKENFNVSRLTRYDSDMVILQRDGVGGNLVAGSLDQLPYEDDSFDICLSSMAMHWQNDVVGTLKEIHRVIKPSRPFVMSLLGNDTLYELRSSLILADQERLGLLGPSYVAPMMRSSDLAGIMESVGFEMVTVDVDDLVVVYPDVYALLEDLQAMGEQNCLKDGRKTLNRTVLEALDPIYRAAYGREAPHDKSVTGLPATFSIVCAIGWKHGDNMPQPKERGTQQKSLKDL